VTQSYQHSPDMARWAMSYAAKGIPVFPCTGKQPLTAHGFKDASADPEQIAAWWSKYPTANIAMPTGEVSGMAVVEKDADTPEALAIWRTLPDGPTAKSGRASGEGRHRYLKATTAVRTRNLADRALTLKGDGGYIILPPSLHPDGNRYEWLRHAPPEDLPEDLLADDRETSSGTRPRNGPRRLRSYDDGGPILKGTRDDALASIGGLLRAQGLEQGEILDELMAINETRCQPPKKPSSIRRIARSVSRYPKGNAPRRDPRVRHPLDGVRREWWGARWRNKTDRDVVHVLIQEGRKHGSLRKDGGVEVSLSYRALAVLAATSRQTVEASIKRLSGVWIKRGSKGSGTISGSIVLLPRANLGHSDHYRVSTSTERASVQDLRAPRLRHSTCLPVMRKGKRIDTIVLLRLGKTCGAILDTLEAYGPTLTVDEIADYLQVSRTRDLRRRNIARLVERGVVTLDGERVTQVTDWLSALEREREVSGEVFQAAYQRRRHREQQAAYQKRHKVKAHRFTMAQMWDRLPRPTSELTRLPDPNPELVTVLRLWSESRPLALKDPPSKIAVTVWAYDLVSFKPTALDVEAALCEVVGVEKMAG
jgi:hypothetical protein